MPNTDWSQGFFAATLVWFAAQAMAVLVMEAREKKRENDRRDKVLAAFERKGQEVER